MFGNLEASGDNAAWPPNLPGRPTQLAVFGIERDATGNGLRYELTFTGKFPDLDKAMYWGAKQEVKALKGGRFLMASRVLWQHELTPEAAAAESFKQMEPQVRRALLASDVGFDMQSALFDGSPDDALQPVDYSKAAGIYVEAIPPAGDDDDDGLGPALEGPPDDEPGWIPPDPRSRPAGRLGHHRPPA